MAAVPTLLLVVRDAFPARGGGVEVLPPVASDRLPPSPFEVLLRAPGAGESTRAEHTATASAVVAHMRGPLAPFAMLRLAGVTVEAVPAGTEVWLDE